MTSLVRSLDTLSNCIFTVVDENYEEYARACFNSIVENYTNHPKVLVYHNNLTEEFKSFVSRLNGFELVYKEMFDVSKLNLGPVDNKNVYMRYFLWTSELDKYDNVLHLDVDTLVLGNLDEVFESDEFLMFNNNEILEGVDIIEKSNEAQDALSSFKISYDVFNPPEFANAGVFVIPKKYRNKEQLFKLLSITKGLSKYLRYADQSAINLWMILNSIPISDRIEYNFQPHFFNYTTNKHELEEVKIVHFAAKKVDTIQFVLWWRMKNIGVDFYKLYKRYLGL